MEEWPERVRLASEKEALGFYITGHPLQGYEKRGAPLRLAHRRAGRPESARATRSAVVGVVNQVREKSNKEKGTRFGFFSLEDLTGTVEVVCWGSRPAQGGRPAQQGWADWEAMVKSDEPILVHGEVRINMRDEENPRAEITATEIQLLSEVRSQKTSEVSMRIDAERLGGELADAAEGRCSPASRGPAPSSVRAVIPEATETTLKVPQKVVPVRRAHRGGAAPWLRGRAALKSRAPLAQAASAATTKAAPASDTPPHPASVQARTPSQVPSAPPAK